MSQIVTEIYDAFRATNIDEGLARAAAAAIAGREDLVTKLDLERAIGQVKGEIGRVETEIGRVETELKGEIGRVETEIGRVETELKAEIGRVETELKGEIGRVERELKGEIGRVETELTGRIGRVEAALKEAKADLKGDLKLLKFAYGPAILGLLIKLVFFP